MPAATSTAATTTTATAGLFPLWFARVHAGHKIPTPTGGNWNFHFQNLLNILQFAHLIGRHKGNRPAIAAGPRGPANAVHIVFRHIGQVIIVNETHIRNIETPGCNIGGDQHFDGPAP